MPGYPDGNFVGATILEVDATMESYQEEIFGPVLCIVKARDLDHALEIINANRYGNGAAIFTQDGATARKFERTVEAGQIGINVPIPVPLPMFAWSGNKASVLGQTSLYGKLCVPYLSGPVRERFLMLPSSRSGIEFWTQHKVSRTAFESFVLL